MGDRNDDDRGGTPPCFLHELPPAEGGLPDAETLRDVARWRRAERQRLVAARRGLSPAVRQAADTALAAALDARLGDTAGRTLAVTWPIRGEPDLRGWARARHAAGTILALPVVVARDRPLIFRRWEPGARLRRGTWNIPEPASEAPEVAPEIVLAPVVGLDAALYRLGNGGGYYDRTLAALGAAGHKPHVIGYGYEFQRLETIFPQHFDIPMDDAVLVDPSG